jgi:hypothetical protein
MVYGKYGDFRMVSEIFSVLYNICILISSPKQHGNCPRAERISTATRPNRSDNDVRKKSCHYQANPQVLKYRNKG